MGFQVTDIDHIALVTRDPRAAAAGLQDVLGAQLLWETRHGAVLDLGGLTLVFESPEIPVMRTFLDTRGEGIQHVGISVSNLDEGIRDAESNGTRLVNPSLEPGGPRREVLVHPRSGAGVLWQVMEWNAELSNDREARRAALRSGEIRVPGLG